MSHEGPCESGKHHCKLDDKCYPKEQFRRTEQGVAHDTGGLQPKHFDDGRIGIGPAIEYRDRQP